MGIAPIRKRRPRGPGPGFVVVAAFLGPGTIATLLVAGSSHGPLLLWAILLSIMLTAVLQDAAARLTLSSGFTLGQVVRFLSPGTAPRRAFVFLVLASAVVGAAAFQTANLLGVAHAATAIAAAPEWWFVVAAADLAFLLLWVGRTRVIEVILAGLVGIMAIAFLVNLALLAPDLSTLRDGLVPQVPDGAGIVAVALVGATLVPYNLFLHATLVRNRGWRSRDITSARFDLGFALLVAGVLVASLLLISSAVIGNPAENAGTRVSEGIPQGLDPAARILFAIGVAAAGLTSAITAPLAASYAMSHVLGWKDDLKSTRMRAIWAAVIAVGLVGALTGLQPTSIVVFATAANAVILPVIATALLFALNNRNLVGRDRNRLLANMVLFVAILFTVALGVMAVANVL